MTDNAANPMTQGHYVLLGQIAEAAGRLQYEAALFAEDLTCDRDDPFRATAGTGFERVLAVITEHVAIKAPAETTAVERLAVIVKDATSAMRDRHKLLHGRWVFVDQDGVQVPAILIRTRKGPATLRMLVTTSELESVLERLRWAFDRLQLFYLAALGWTGAFEDDGTGGLRRIAPRPPLR